MSRFTKCFAGLSASLLVVACSGMGRVRADDAEGMCDLTELDEESEGSREPLMVKCDCDVAAELMAIEEADPLSDASIAVGRGDMRFVGVMEYSVLTPGVSDQKAIQKHGVRVIEGTSDVVRCYEQARLSKLAREYASTYNQRILEATTSQSPAYAE